MMLLALVSRYPIYDLMRDYLTLSWARFSKDVQSHTLQISKILSHPAPRPGELVRLYASPPLTRKMPLSYLASLSVFQPFRSRLRLPLPRFHPLQSPLSRATGRSAPIVP